MVFSCWGCLFFEHTPDCSLGLGLVEKVSRLKLSSDGVQAQKPSFQGLCSTDLKKQDGQNQVDDQPRDK